MLTYHISVVGLEDVHRKIVRMGVGAQNAQPVMHEIGRDMMDIARATFQSQGRRGGGQWRFLAPETVRRKLRTGQDPRIMFASHALFQSLTVEGDPNQVFQVSNDSVHLASTLPYAAKQHASRPLFKITRQDRSRWDKMIADHILGYWRLRRSSGYVH